MKMELSELYEKLDVIFERRGKKLDKMVEELKELRNNAKPLIKKLQEASKKQEETIERVRKETKDYTISSLRLQRAEFSLALSSLHMDQRKQELPRSPFVVASSLKVVPGSGMINPGYDIFTDEDYGIA